MVKCFAVLPASRTPTGKVVESFGGGSRSLAASTKCKGKQKSDVIIIRDTMSSSLTEILPFPES